MITKGNNKLNTTTLPQYNCSNCEHFCKEQFVFTKDGESYAVECNNLVHPLEDCVLRGFEGHSAQPTFAQTLNAENNGKI